MAALAIMRLDFEIQTNNSINIWVDSDIDRIEVEHNGAITWDELQYIKNAVWGEDAAAIEVYPSKADVVNGGNYRHLWRWHSKSEPLPSLIDSGLHVARQALHTHIVF